MGFAIPWHFSPPKSRTLPWKFGPTIGLSTPSFRRKWRPLPLQCCCGARSFLVPRQCCGLTTRSLVSAFCEGTCTRHLPRLCCDMFCMLRIPVRCAYGYAALPVTATRQTLPAGERDHPFCVKPSYRRWKWGRGGILSSAASEVKRGICCTESGQSSAFALVTVVLATVVPACAASDRGRCVTSPHLC